MVEKFAYQRILADEQDIDFSANKFWHEEHVHHHHFYPNSYYVPQNSVYSQTQAQSYNYDIPKSNNIQPNPEIIYTPKPQTPPQQSQQGFRNNENGYFYPNPVTPYNPVEWLKRYVRDLQLRKAPNEIIPHQLRKVRNAHHHSLPFHLLNETVFQEIVKKTRVKRQSFGREQLCVTRESFVLPQAALNTKGIIKMN